MPELEEHRDAPTGRAVEAGGLHRGLCPVGYEKPLLCAPHLESRACIAPGVGWAPKWMAGWSWATLNKPLCHSPSQIFLESSLVQLWHFGSPQRVNEPEQHIS